MLNDKIRIEIDAQSLERMIDSGHLSASDMRCLDCNSKRCIWRMCLSICADKLNIPTECITCPKRNNESLSNARGFSQEEAQAKQLAD